MEVLKKVLNIIIDIFIVLVVIVSATIAVISLTARDSGVPDLFGYVPFSVQSNSMSPVFQAGDLIVGKKVEDNQEYKVGDIITFWAFETDENGNNTSFLNTHRIVDIVDKTEDGAGIVYETKGDNNQIKDSTFVNRGKIVAIWAQENKDDGIKFGKLGSVLDYLRKPSGFFIAVLLPMIVFFIYELVRFITNFMNYNKEKQKEAALQAAKELMGDDSSDSSGLSEDQKAQAILDYLEKQKAEKEGEDAPPDAEAKPESEDAPDPFEEEAESVKPETADSEAAQPEAAETDEAKPAEEAEPSAEESEKAEETEQPAAESTEAVTEPEQEETVSEAQED